MCLGDTADVCLGDLVAAPGPREEPEDQYAIAAKVGCSQMHISRLLRRALARMRAQLGES